MHDLMTHLRDEPQARYSNVRDVFGIYIYIYIYIIYLAVFSC
jgi:hypothetical protein